MNDLKVDSEILEKRPRLRVDEKVSVSSAQFTAYIDNRMSSSQKEIFERLIGSDEKLMAQLQDKLDEREFIKSSLPEVELSANSLDTIKSEIRDINANVLVTKDISWFSKVWQWLNKPFLEV